jgi:drug/metabolite transporter (DMT)-like permease
MSVALAGVVAIHVSPSGAGHATLLGNLFVFLGSIAFALFTVFGKRATARHGGTLVNTFAYVGGAIALLPVTIWLSIGFPYARVTLAEWGALLFMAVFPSVVCYMIYYWALTHTAASRVSAFNYLQPLIAAALAVPLLGEAVTPMLAAGGILVLAGVYMTERG